MSSVKYEFRYMPLVGKLSGESMAKQTETAINEIAEIVNENTAQADIINTLAQDANDNSVEALEKANEALETSSRVYIHESLAVNLDSYCESQLIYVANISSTNLPIAKKGFLEVKTDDDKTECVQLFVSDDKDVYVRSGSITAEIVGDITVYTADFEEWTSLSSPTILLQAGNGTSIPLSADLNDYNTEGTFYCSTTNVGSIAHCPVSEGEFKLIVMKFATANYGLQMLYPSGQHLYVRKYSGGTWGNWEVIVPKITSGVTNGSIAVNNTDVAVTGWNTKADLDSPVFVGTPTAPTPANSDNSTKLATTEFVNTKAGNCLPLTGGTLTGQLTLNAQITAFTDRYAKLQSNYADSSAFISFNGGNGDSEGARLVLNGKNSDDGSFNIIARSPSVYKILIGRADGTLTWGGQNVLTASNYSSYALPLSGGTMTGATTFENNVYRKLSARERGTNPSSNTEPGVLMIMDKNNADIGSITYHITTSGDSSIRIRSFAWSATESSFYMALENDSSSNRNVRPYPDNSVNLGTSSFRWKQVYAASSTISTSDERLKDNIEAIPDEVLDAWGEVNWYQYQFKDSIAEKGETKARIHTGAIAQRIESVFESHGLDANRYGLLCYDKWDATPAEKDEDGNIITPAQPAGNRYSLRYEEALCMEAAYQRRRADRLEERIEALEKLLMNRTE